MFVTTKVCFNVVVVTGIVENQSSIRLQVPSILQVVILDNNQKEIIISDFPSPVEDLGSGSNFEYEFVIADIPSEINNILVRFKVNDQNVNVEDEKKDEQIENNKSQASSGRKINKEKAAKLKKVFE
mgnify:FL=1